MENNEIMNTVEEVTEANDGMIAEVCSKNMNGNVKAALIGAGIVGAGVALFEIGKKMYSKIKAKKKEHKEVIETEFVERSDEGNEVVED